MFLWSQLDVLTWLTLMIIIIITMKESSEEVLGNVNITRSERFFPFIIPPFVFKRNLNTSCTTALGLDGTCMTRTRCTQATGAASGYCGTGTAVICCVFVRSCGETTSTRVTYFTSPGYPATYAGGSMCTLSINKLTNNTCQLKIEFLSLSLAQPNSSGVCQSDFLTFSDQDAPTLCGENSNQHVYIDYDSGSSFQRINIDTDTNTAFNRIWNLKITQIPCNSSERAPMGCLQYYNETSGTVSSFNFGDSVPTTVSNSWTRQLSNLHYGACVQRAVGYCSIEWSASANSLYSFTVSEDTTIATPGDTTEALTGDLCTHNYVIIPNSIATGDRFCGNAFNMLTTNVEPYVLYSVTNFNSSADNGNRGFELNYRQLPC